MICTSYNCKKTILWKCLEKADVYVYKVNETKQAFYQITANDQIDRILDNKEIFSKEDLEVITPPEYTAARSVH